MYVNERLAALRRLMKEKNIDIYLIPTADFHNSENVGDYFKAREYMSGFTGSAGSLVVTADYAGLWTDGRYFLQAENQLEGTRIELQRMGEEGTPTIEDFIVDTMPKAGKLGFDGRVVMYGEGKNLANRLKRKGASVVYNVDLIGDVWKDRPSLSRNKAFALRLEQAGQSVADKLKRVREEMHSYGANAHIITSLDDIGWLLNVRGTDVEFYPLLLSYTIVYENKVELYVDESKLSDEIKTNLSKDKVVIKEYNAIYDAVKEFEYSDVVLVDPDLLNYAIYNNIPKEVTLVEKRNPTILMKAMKNEVEIDNIIKAHIKDGVAHTKFIYWLKKLIKEGKIQEETEMSASDKLVEFRKAQGDYIFPSFPPIFGHGPNGAIIHYSSSEETNRKLTTGTLLLTDSGSHFMQGSTDITRTHALGEISKELKSDYTRVLKANLSLSKVKFAVGVAGQNLDVLARQHLWENHQDYRHGTGHGVGYIGNIHEGPANIRWQVPASGQVEALREGMIVTNEPGLYIAGSHGIRLENELLVRKSVKNDFGQFMKFEVITYAPFDLDAIDLSLMTDVDREELNKYHARVYELIGPHLTDEERVWLKEATREI